VSRRLEEASLRAGDIVEAAIEKGVYRGRGLARHQGRVIFVPRAHPLDEREHFLRVPRPELHSRERARRIAGAVQHVVVHRERVGKARFDREHVESHVGDEELEHAMFELEELACAMCLFTKSDKANVFENLFEWL